MVCVKKCVENYSVGKVQVRAWADKGGRIATNSGTYNWELRVVFKLNWRKSKSR